MGVHLCVVTLPYGSCGTEIPVSDCRWEPKVHLYLLLWSSGLPSVKHLAQTSGCWLPVKSTAGLGFRPTYASSCYTSEEQRIFSTFKRCFLLLLGKGWRVPRPARPPLCEMGCKLGRCASWVGIFLATSQIIEAFLSTSETQGETSSPKFNIWDRGGTTADPKQEAPNREGIYYRLPSFYRS